ncbi:hypothetical protein [Methanolobus sp. ZRKC5]|uniref:hypothetical protein n=1 Tax=unclassified Methanolobus TaxID=2629569 RepID=UPI00313E213B
MNKPRNVQQSKYYKCYNCGFSKEVVIPCNDCGEGEVKCPFCGEKMARGWE